MVASGASLGWRRACTRLGIMSLTGGSHTITLEGAYVHGGTAPVVLRPMSSPPSTAAS